jgi:hypothetical protein
MGFNNGTSDLLWYAQKLIAHSYCVCSSRIIRQSSQPEASAPASCSGQCVHHLHGSAPTQPSVSLRQLREPGDGIAGIAADSLRINGAIRQFKQVLTEFSVL